MNHSDINNHIQNFCESSHASFMYIAGASGTGKTTILEAIQTYVAQEGNARKVLYIEIHKIVERLLRASDVESFAAIQNEFNSYEILLVDHLEELGGKDSTLTWLFDIFRNLFLQGSSVAVSLCLRPGRENDFKILDKLREVNLCESKCEILLDESYYILNKIVFYLNIPTFFCRWGKFWLSLRIYYYVSFLLRVTAVQCT